MRHSEYVHSALTALRVNVHSHDIHSEYMYTAFSASTQLSICTPLSQQAMRHSEYRSRHLSQQLRVHSSLSLAEHTHTQLSQQLCVYRSLSLQVPRSLSIKQACRHSKDTSIHTSLTLSLSLSLSISLSLSLSLSQQFDRQLKKRRGAERELDSKPSIRPSAHSVSTFSYSTEGATTP
jgi:hypothetical protein